MTALPKDEWNPEPAEIMVLLSVHWGINPPPPLPKNTPPFLPSFPLNLQTVQTPFSGNSPYILFFCDPPSPKIRFFSEPQ